MSHSQEEDTRHSQGEGDTIVEAESRVIILNYNIHNDREDNYFNSVKL